MKVSIIGTGYVGLVTGACLADVGNDVLCLDVDQGKIERLKRGEIPIYEPGLQEVVHANVAAGRLAFTTDIAGTARFARVQMIAVGTPPGEDGSADLQYVLAAARGIGTHMDGPRVIVDKSTVPVGTADKVRDAVAEVLAKRGASFGFSMVSNPEFLKEGAAVEDFMRPDRIVIGAQDPEAIAVMRELYAPFQRNHERLQVMDIRSAELTKYAANAMLATRISFMNELALLAEKLGADIEHVRVGIGSDPRIGYHFLYPGAGFGGSCFPKDVTALLRTGRECGIDLKVVRAVEEANERQKGVLVEKIAHRFGADLTGRRFAIWGLAFKPNTDDMREAPSRVVIDALRKRGAEVVGYDPVAMPEAGHLYGDDRGVSFAASAIDAAKGADAVVIVTEWKAFRSPDFEALKKALRNPVVFDGRNLYDPAVVRNHGFEYHAIGRAAPAEAQGVKIPQDFARARLLVVGDVMLDRYWFGDVSRISPEAPVPVVHVQRTEERPGGAANVARNITALGAHCRLLSVVGEDEAGASLSRLLESDRVEGPLHRDAGFTTTVKLRVIGQQQQLLRIDFERAPGNEVLDAKLDEFKRLVDAADAVVLSDYGKGTLAHVERMIAAARSRGKPVLVDPKGSDYERYRGATLLTPNRSEFREVAGRWKDEADLERRAQQLRADLDLEALIVTRSEEGMSLFTASESHHEHTRAREVFDVSGAGDTVIAVVALMVAMGAPLHEAMRVANHAAGIVVAKLGTAVVHPEELAESLASRQ